MIKRHNILEVVVDSVIFPNIGIVTGYSKEIRIKGALKGEKLKIVISKERSNYFEGKVREVLEKSPLEKEGSCQHFGKCGGCSYQTLNYKEELQYKIEQVENLFEKKDIEIEELDIIPSPNLEGYRNKMEFTFGDEYKDGPLSLGMRRKGRYYEIESVYDCNIADSDFTTILEGTLNHFQETDFTFYHSRMHKGHLRNLSVRKALSTGEIMVNLVTSSQKEIDGESFKDMILDLDLEGEIVGVFHTINDGLGDAINVDRLINLYGRDYIIEEICGLKFKVSLFSFFQTNTFGAEKLYELARDFIGETEDKVIFDLYSGTGTIAQIMAEKADKVIAVEIVEDAVEMARENSKINKLDNIEFHQGDVGEVVESLDYHPDIIVIDPPRPGLEKAAKKIVDFNPDRVLYISCNPVTMVRDLEVFLENGYKIEKTKLVDQFPRTPHVEAVMLLVKQ